MNKSVLYIIFLIFSLFGKAQENLVPNGSFEEFNTCPIGIADLSAKAWSSPTGATPDYYNICNSNDVSIPNNYAGKQLSNSGFGYAGFIAGGFTELQSEAREYLQVKLNEDLIENEFYELSFFLSLAEISRFACKKIEFAFSDVHVNAIISTNITFLQNIHEVEIEGLSDTSNWVKCSCKFLANGSERYLIIGLFKDDSNAEYSLFNVLMNEFSYYYIDDVKLNKVKFPSIPNVFTPNNDGINDIWTFVFALNVEIQIINRWGNIVYSSVNHLGTINWDGNTLDNHPCSEGVYFYVIKEKKKKIKTGFIQLIK